jgi:hypothetical protein
VDSIGKIIAILNENQVLIRSDEPLVAGEEVAVFDRISTEPLSVSGIPYLDFPKGRLKITSLQHPGVYLANRFVVSTERVPRSSLGSNAFLSLLGEQEIKSYSAKFDEAANMQIATDRTIRVDDHVSK